MPPYSGVFKVIYPKSSILGESGSVQIALSGRVYQYAIFYSVCAEKGKYGDLQNYMATTDPVVPVRTSVMSAYGDETPPPPDEPEPEPEKGSLRIVKLENGAETPLEGAVFEVKGPDGDVIGSFVTDADGEITVPDAEPGNYTVTELSPPSDHLLCDQPTQNVTVPAGGTATLTFYNDPYGNLRVEKYSDTGEGLEGVTVQIRNIVTGETRSAQTGPGGAAMFERLVPGAYEVRETAGIGIKGWKADTDTVQTVTVVAGETSAVTFTNKELPGLRIVKYDRETMEVLPGVTFQVWQDSRLLGEYTTNALGEIVIPDAEPGTYVVQEVQSDNDHVTETTARQVELKAGDGIIELVFFNDLKPGMHLVKVDSADLSRPIANARFRVEGIGVDFSQEFTTDERGEIDLSHLEPGAYQVTELECPGYIVDDARRVIHLRVGQNAQFVFTNSRDPSLHLIKISADGSRLAGVSFRLAKIEDGSRYLDRVTDQNGEILWEGLEPGVYSLTETATLDDHILSLREHHVELFPGKTSTVVLENDRRPDLTVHKRDADTGEAVPGAVFLVKSADGHSVQEVRTGQDGTAAVENLLPGVYEVSAKSVPAPYLLDADSQLITLYPNRDRDVYFENHRAPNLTVQKLDSVTGNPVQGARFSVVYASNHTDTGEINDLGYFYTDENGQFTVESTRDGWYKIEEVEPAEGYAIKEPAAQEIYLKAGENGTVTFENTPLSALVVWKFDTVTGLPVEGAVFQVRYLGGTSGTGGTVIGTYKTSANGSFTVTGLKAGTYIVEELASDEDHVADSVPQTVVLSGQEQDVVQLYFGNRPKGSLLIRKIDAVTHAPLSDVEFLVTDSHGAFVGGANGVYTTDSAGTILIDGLVPGVTLVVRETGARDGYLLDDTPQTITVRPGQTMTLEFRNQPRGGLIVQKLDSVTKEPLEGVQFKITYADGSNVDAEGGKLSSNGLYRTDENGQIVLGGVTGTLVVTEVETIPGYVIREEARIQTVVVRPDDTQTLSFYNDPVGGVELVEVSAADRTRRIPNVTFEIRAMNGALADVVTTDSAGRAFAALDDGAYYAVEIETAKGLKLDDTPRYFEVENGKSTVLTVENRPFSGVMLHKIDSITGEGVYGAVFLLYDENRNPLGQYETDQNGWLYTDDLAEGRYFLKEMEAEGYLVDGELKTVYVKEDSTVELEWENTPLTGRIQITKTSEDDNPANGKPAGTPLEGTVFEVYDLDNELMDTVTTDRNGIAATRDLPLGRYLIRETQATDLYVLNDTPVEVEIGHSGQTVRVNITNKLLDPNVSISKTGYEEVMPGQSVRYELTDIGNKSNVALDSFYWRDVLPTEAVALDRIVTGTYTGGLTYSVVYQTNRSSGACYTLAGGLSTDEVYTLEAGPAALDLAADEYVTEFLFVFGAVPVGFQQVEKAQVYCAVKAGLTGGGQFTNVADVGGEVGGQWHRTASRWVTDVYTASSDDAPSASAPSTPAETLPKTGY